jgi:hypothetical protein
MNERTVNLVKALSVGRCSCYHINGSGNIATFDPMTGEVTPGHYNPGHLVQCLRCQAREALDADGVVYTKDDRMIMTVQN